MNVFEWTVQSAICLLKKRYGQMVVSTGGFGNRVFDGIAIIDRTNQLSTNLEEGLRQHSPQYVVCHSSIATEVLNLTDGMDIRVGIKITESSFAHADLSFPAGSRVHLFCEEQWIVQSVHSNLGMKPILVRPIVLPWISRVQHKTNPDRIVCFCNQSSSAGLAASKISFDQIGHEPIFMTRGTTESREIPQMPYMIYRQAVLLVIDSRTVACVSHLVLEAILNEVPVVIDGEYLGEEWQAFTLQVKDRDNEIEWASRIQECIHPSAQAVMRERLHHNAIVVHNCFQSADSYNELLS